MSPVPEHGFGGGAADILEGGRVEMQQLKVAIRNAQSIAAAIF